MKLHGLGLALGIWAVSLWTAAGQNWGIVKTGGDPAMQIMCDGELVSKYHTQDVAKPYFYPLIGPGGTGITRGAPMDPQPDEATDHPHHRSLWFGHGAVNGVDFWHEGDGRGTIVHTALGSMKMGSGQLTFTTRNDWMKPDKTTRVCQDERTYRFSKTPEGALAVDFDILIKASDGDVTFGDTKEGSMALRLIPTLQTKGPVAKGKIVNSEGLTDNAAWGKRAPWCDAFGPDREGKTVGVALFSHPENPRHPAAWHVRDYGLFAANPFGSQQYDKAGPSGDFTVKNGETLRLRFRVFLHLDDAEKAGVAKAYAAYVKE